MWLEQGRYREGQLTHLVGDVHFAVGDACAHPHAFTTLNGRCGAHTCALGRRSLTVPLFGEFMPLDTWTGGTWSFGGGISAGNLTEVEPP
jgi:hypothetical protein